MIYQMISLNVAVNSFDHALLTLLVSNQFVEIKGSVFKKFEKDNLFQITCAGMCGTGVTYPTLWKGLIFPGIDIVERFTLFLMLVVVAFRNLIELSGSSFNFSEGFALPKSFGWFHGKNTLWIISYVSSDHSTSSEQIFLTPGLARHHRHDLWDASRLAQACFHLKVQSYQAISLWTLYGCPLSGFVNGKHCWKTWRTKGSLDYWFNKHFPLKTWSEIS